MYDAINAKAIPTTADLIAGYVDGPISKWADSDWALFPNAIKVQICTWGPRHHGNCLDVETGDSVPSDIPDWADDALKRGVSSPIVYCGMWTWPECKKYAGSRPVQWWIANPTNIPHILPGSDATQWGWSASVTGGDYDLSLCVPEFPKGLSRS